MTLRNSKSSKIGLLPLYLKLYDEVMPEIRIEFNPFIATICDQFKSRNIEVVQSEISRVSSEFKNAIAKFEKEEVDCIVTLHLAYSPSLECIDALSSTKLPIIILDTTRDEYFNSISLLMYNHGIHGVQDMCNMLLRKGKDFIIESGHISSSKIIDQVASHIKGAKMAKSMKNARVGQMGESFKGMGDFMVDSLILKNTLGIQVIKINPDHITELLPNPNEAEVLNEMAKDNVRFNTSKLRPEAHQSAVITGLAFRRWIHKENLSAFTINFQTITKKSGVPQMPFLEICKAMSNGIGYAGEGDALTAALVGAIAQVLGEVSFTEMFCPDWKNNLIFMSHMGEMNIDLIEGKAALLEKEESFTDAPPPVYPSACFKKGNAIFVNLAPGLNDTFSLILSPIEMVSEDIEKTMGDGIRGWMKPGVPISDFLKKYSEAGGTHHAAIVYGQAMSELKTFGKIMNWRIIEIA